MIMQRLRNYHHRLVDRGDTIVEVMVVLAILGLALGISYSTADRSLKNTRQAEDTSEAAEITQSQVEALHYLAPDSSVATENIFSAGHLFCINLSGLTGTNPIVIFSSNNYLNYGGYPAACKTASQSYVTAIAYCPNTSSGVTLCTTANLVGEGGEPGPTGDAFVVKTSWPDPLSNTYDTSTLIYRIHKVTQ